MSNYEGNETIHYQPGFFPISTLIRDAKFMHILNEIKEDFFKGCKNFSAILLQSSSLLSPTPKPMSESLSFQLLTSRLSVVSLFSGFIVRLSAAFIYSSSISSSVGL